MFLIWAVGGLMRTRKLRGALGRGFRRCNAETEQSRQHTKPLYNYLASLILVQYIEQVG